mmetsp:Transcript_7112/g.11612  ORF Transcript_7112/g.11612 Transcript_7112/m.11612 type:complete len:631 (-) Transcript_7112:42-1934(-)
MIWRKRQALVALLLLSASVASAARFNLKPWRRTKTIKTSGKQSTAPAEPVPEAEASSDTKEKSDGVVVQSAETRDMASSEDSHDDNAGNDKGEKEVPTTADDSNSTKSDHGDVKTSESSPSTNQTLNEGNKAVPQHAHNPYARPTPYVVMTSRKPQPQSSSLLSSILKAFVPIQPPHSPPSPFGPGIFPPNSPPPPPSILSLLLRLVLLSFTTQILDFFRGSHSDAFIPSTAQHYTFERVNDRYRRDGSALMQALASPPPGVRKFRWKRIFHRRRNANVDILTDSTKKSMEPPSIGNGELYNRTVIILDMKPDSRVGNGMADQLRDTVSFLIEQHRDHTDRRRAISHLPHLATSRTAKGIRPAIGAELEILLILDSPGGTVQDYGLAASQLSRLRNEPQIKLTVCVDRVAASGGYMMASQATPGQLFAAPFAMVGSIGVLMETVNLHDILSKNGIKPLIIKAGKNKAPLKSLGEVTPEELEMAQDDANVIHQAFQKWVTKSRNISGSQDWLDKVATGAVFLGAEACELGLVDRVVTSDEYVAERVAAGDRVLRLVPYRGSQLGLRLSPLDLLTGLDAEGRAKLTSKIKQLGPGICQTFASLFRVGSAVGALNLVHHFASLHSQRSFSFSG